MKNVSIKSAVWVLIIIDVLFLSSCTIIGLIMGSSAYKQSLKPIIVSGWKIEEINKDEVLTFYLKSGDSIKGKYVQTELKKDEDYTLLYENDFNTLSSSINLPKIGDTLVLEVQDLIKKNTLNYIKQPFSAFGSEYILLKDNNNIDKWYSFKNLISGRLSSGVNLDLDQIQQLIKSGKLANIQQILLDNNVTINPNQIQSVVYKNEKKNAALYGLMVGAILDGLIIFAVGSNFSLDIGGFNNSGSGGGGGSCPYIYSYDGENYHLDSETFGGAIFKAAQRTDIDNLDFLKEHNGYYKLRLTNELDETEYVDEFKLWVADHPEGTKVMPSFDGKLHVLNTLQAPSDAIDRDGNNVRHLIASRDDKVWISNPFNRNPDIPGDGRDAMEVTYKKPVNAETVKLAFNVQNTLWAASLQRDMLALHGNKLQDWYQLMNTSEPARKAFIDAMIREGMLLVQVWDGGKWQTRDYIWEVGPFIPKDQVVVLDLKDIEGEQIKIRLESTVGFWMINSIGADFTNTDTPDVRELEAQSARDHIGKNVLEILKYNDGNYHVMPTTKDKVDIIFKAIPEKRNFSRTYLIKCSGYYNIHTNETGEPKLALLNQMIKEPGLYGQFVLRKLNNELAVVGK